MDEPSKGSHWKCSKEGFGVYPIPAHKGQKQEISDRYIEGLCNHFDLDEKAFRKAL